MKKFASFKVFGVTIFIFLVTCSATDFICQEIPGLFQNPVIKCWEIKSDSINSIASDNEFLILQNENGEISRIEKSSSNEIWKTSVGEKNDSIISFESEGINLVSVENNNLLLRKLDSRTGIVKELIRIGKLNKEISFENLKSLIVTGKYTDLTTLIKTLLQTVDSLKNIDKEVPPQIFPYDNTSYLMSDGRIIEQVSFDGLNKTQLYKIKTDAQRISLIATVNNLLIWGDEGGVFLKKSGNDIPKRILRTGGRITSIRNSGNNLLITSSDNFLYFYSLTKERVLWKKRLSGRVTIDPKIEGRTAVVTTNAVSELIFIDLETGKTFNQITFPDETFIEDFLINKDSIFVLTNGNLTRLSEKCR